MQRLMRHVPNILTVARLLALPFFVWTYALDAPGAAWTTAWIVLFMALSDVPDGLIARKYHVQSEFGRWVDPIVDRLFFFTLVAMLWYFGTLPWWAVLPLLIRDGIILAADRPVAAVLPRGPADQPLGQGQQLHPHLRHPVVHHRSEGGRLDLLRRGRDAVRGHRLTATATGRSTGCGRRGEGAAQPPDPRATLGPLWYHSRTIKHPPFERKRR